VDRATELVALRVYGNEVTRGVMFPAELCGQMDIGCPIGELDPSMQQLIPDVDLIVQLATGNYVVLIELTPASTGSFGIQFEGWEPCCNLPIPPCPDCLSSFSPLPNRTYILNAWVSKADLPVGSTSISGPYVRVESPVNVELQGAPSIGPMIDGWQLMEWRFVMSSGEPDILVISLGCTDGDALFDDIRVFPDGGTQKSYVYDPRDHRFVAELDDRHFATLYEYDHEGRMVRVKKETERGVMTIQETRQRNVVQY